MPPDLFTLDEAQTALAAIRDPLAALQAIQVRLRDVRAELNALGRRHLNDGVVAEQSRSPPSPAAAARRRGGAPARRRDS